MADEQIQLTKKDRLHVWWRSQFLQASWNYERMQNVGWAYSMIPALKKLYKTEDDRAAALKRHLEFFNTHPYLASPVLGVEMSLEEKRANGAAIDDKAIQGVKIGMMGPLAGVGDPIFWGTMRPVIGAFAASLALKSSWLGPIFFFVVWNVMRMAFLWYTQELGYRQGENITQDLSGGFMQKLTTGASILGMFIMGVLVPRWTTMKFPMITSTIANDKKSLVDFSAINGTGAHKAEDWRNVIDQIRNGSNVDVNKVTTLQATFDQLIYGLMPLLLTLVCVWLLRKKVSPIIIIFALFGLGILGYWSGVLGA
ncbi:MULTISPECIES: PTS system mannose/fructose/sorbose family transporter subunit IID [Lacticaseibacillus]|uniref:PTS system mannose/fructose/sorbose family transporter subunit IID n=2 Tax=Lacticaseibacillus TaxID=2759736 RepID=A0ABW4CFR1_9LACO|nr:MULTISPECIES: PTS system mannose/fructose/sorbose family transporter subunit IID [Lacticaseibacillus]